MINLLLVLLQVQSLYPATPTNYVTDVANVIQNETRFNTELKYIKDSLGVNVAVVTLPTIGQYQPSEVALGIGRDWGVASKGEIGQDTRNAGLVLLIVPKGVSPKGYCRIETARGAEGFITDSKAGEWCREAISFFKYNDYDSGVGLILDRIKASITKQAIVIPAVSSDVDFPWVLVISIIGVGVVAWLIFKPKKRVQPAYVSKPYVPFNPHLTETGRIPSTPNRTSTPRPAPSRPAPRKTTYNTPVEEPKRKRQDDDYVPYVAPSYSPPPSSRSDSSSFDGFSGGSSSDSGFSGGGGGSEW